MTKKLYEDLELTSNEKKLLIDIISGIEHLILPRNESELTRLLNEKGKLEKLIETVKNKYAHDEAYPKAMYVASPLMGSMILLAIPVFFLGMSSIILGIINLPLLVSVWQKIIDSFANVDPTIAIAVTISIIAAIVIASLGTYFGIKAKTLNAMHTTVNKVGIDKLKDHFISKTSTTRASYSAAQQKDPVAHGERVEINEQGKENITTDKPVSLGGEGQ